MALLLDTGILYAGYDRSDSWHEAAKSLLAENPRGLIVPAPVIPEVDYLLGKRLGSQARTAFYQGLADGHYFVAELPAEGYATVAELNRQFADLELGFVDAAVVALASQLGLRKIATVDRRHFGPLAFRFRLELVP
ncbi:MAG: PIN domain-containing protein [Thermoanaerobaculia bacterium]